MAKRLVILDTSTSRVSRFLAGRLDGDDLPQASTVQEQSQAEAWRQAWLAGQVSINDVPEAYRRHVVGG